MNPALTCRLSAGLALAVCSAVTLAQNPGAGTLTIHDTLIEYDEGPNIGVNLTPASDPGDGSGIVCNPVLACDHFELSIDLPENIAEVFPSATLRYSATSDGGGAGNDDYDFYMYDANGDYVSHSASGGGSEAISELANGGVTERRFSIVYFTTTGSSYKGRYELRLGDPAPGADLDAFFGRCPADDAECEAATARLSGTLKQGGADARLQAGALPPLALLLLGLAGAWRRRMARA